MDVTVTITAPVLGPGEIFNVSYQQGNGPIIHIGAETNAGFTISGLTDGDYTVYATNECGTATRCFTISEKGDELVCGDCPDFKRVYIIDNGNGIAYVHMQPEQTLPAECIYVILYQDASSYHYPGGPFITIYYNTNSLISGEIVFQCSPVPTHVRVMSGTLAQVYATYQTHDFSQLNVCFDAVVNP